MSLLKRILGPVEIQPSVLLPNSRNLAMKELLRKSESLHVPPDPLPNMRLQVPAAPR
jgi:hypothetical protein